MMEVIRLFLFNLPPLIYLSSLIWEKDLEESFSSLNWRLLLTRQILCNLIYLNFLTSCQKRTRSRSGCKKQRLLLQCICTYWWELHFSFSRDAAYRFLCNPKYDWQSLTFNIATFIIRFICDLNKDNKEQINCLVVDDTMIERSRGKKVELLSRQFNHVIGKTVKGFTDLAQTELIIFPY